MCVCVYVYVREHVEPSFVVICVTLLIVSEIS